MSLCVFGVSPRWEREGGRGDMRVVVGNIVCMCVFLAVCVSWRTRTGKRNRTNHQCAERQQRHMRVPFFISNSSSTDPRSSSFLPPP